MEKLEHHPLIYPYSWGKRQLKSTPSIDTLLCVFILSALKHWEVMVLTASPNGGAVASNMAIAVPIAAFAAGVAYASLKSNDPDSR